MSDLTCPYCYERYDKCQCGRSPLRRVNLVSRKRYSVRARVYVAGPISIGDLKSNVERGIQMGEVLSRHGYAAIVPHYDMLWNSEAVAGTALYEECLQRDFSFISVCQAVLRLSGPSKGADREVAWARSIGVPVFLSLEELFEKIPPSQLLDILE